MLKSGVGSRIIPNDWLTDFSGFSAGLPAKLPETRIAFWLVTESLTWTKNVADDGEISGSDGARNPRPRAAEYQRVDRRT